MSSCFFFFVFLIKIYTLTNDLILEIKTDQVKNFNTNPKPKRKTNHRDENKQTIAASSQQTKQLKTKEKNLNQ